jgi:hypothetical protein
MIDSCRAALRQGCSLYSDRRRGFLILRAAPARPGRGLDGCATLSNTRPSVSGSVSALTSRAMSMKRLNCSGSSGGGLGLRGISP